MKILMMTILCSFALGAQARIDWNGFSLHHPDIDYAINERIQQECPTMFAQEVFKVVDVEDITVDQGQPYEFRIELKGRGYGTGDPDHHFVVVVDENNYGQPGEYDDYVVYSFKSLAECH